MTRLLTVLLLLAATAHPGPAAVEGRWRFSFLNGDHLHGTVRKVRGPTLFVLAEGAPARAIPVRLETIVRADEVQPESAEDPAPPFPQILRLTDGAVLVGRFRGVDQGELLFEVEALGALRFRGQEIDELLPTSDVVHAYRRATARGPGAAALDTYRFEALWTLLGRSDPNRAWHAQRALVRAGVHALPLLAERLRHQPDAPEEILRLVRALDDDSPAARERAHRSLATLGALAVPHLRSAAAQASAEGRRRIEVLLEEIRGGEHAETSLEVLRVLRAVRVLEEIGSEEAYEILRRLAHGAQDAPTTREARLALERGAHRGK